MSKLNFHFTKICINIEEHVLWKFRYMSTVPFLRIGPNHSLLAHFDIGHPPWLAVLTPGAVLEFTATSSSVLWTWESLAREPMS